MNQRNKKRCFLIPELLLVLLLFPVLSRAVTLRVATYNVETIGAQGTAQYNNLKSVINRVCADIVLIQELNNTSDITNLSDLAADTGYAYHEHADISGTMSGDLRNACMSHYQILSFESWSSVEISGDSNANDITRDIFQCRISLPESEHLGVITVHLKSRSQYPEPTPYPDRFRRQIEVIRLCDVIDEYQTDYPQDMLIVTGDWNENYNDGPFGSNSWSSVPSGMPPSYQLGSDISFPVVYEPFQCVMDKGLTMCDATWEDTTGSYGTRTSNRRLDYIFYSTNDFSLLEDEVYKSDRDNGIDDSPPGNFMTLCGTPLPSSTSEDASDHYTVLADLEYNPEPTPTALPGGALLITEVLANPSGTEPDAEWVEIYNCSSSVVDISGYILTDEEEYPAVGNEGAVRFPSGSTIDPYSTVTIANSGSTFQTTYGFAPDFEINDTGAVTDMQAVSGFNSFGLANSGDEAGLFDASDRFIDSCEWGSSAPAWASQRHSAGSNGQSLERCPSCTDTDDCSSDFQTHSSDGDPGDVCDPVSETPTPQPPTQTPVPTHTPTPAPTSGPGSVLITEVLYDASGYTEPDAEWIELKNCGSGVVDISGFTLTDSANYPATGSEGAIRFPAGAAIQPGQVLVIANLGETFQQMFGTLPDYEMNASDPPLGIPQMDAVSGFSVPGLSNTSDELALFDSSDAVVDSCEWGSGAAIWATARHSDVSAGNSLERCPSCTDTDDCSTDFQSHSGNGDPGQVCDAATPTPQPPTPTPQPPTPTPQPPTPQPPTPTPQPPTNTPSVTPTGTPTATPTGTPTATPTGSLPPLPTTDFRGLLVIILLMTFVIFISALGTGSRSHRK